MKTFFPHQQRVFSWAEGRDRVALFLEMRLGKTLVTIRWLVAAGARRVLVVAPLTVLSSWETELADEGLKSVVLRGSRSRKWKLATQPRFGWFLINYEGLRTCSELTAIKWDAVVADESTRLKNPQAQITKLMTRRLDHVRWRAVLSGLPAPESPQDYFSQMVFVGDEFMGTDNFWKWRERHFNQVGYDWMPRKGTLAAIRQALDRQAFFLTRKEVSIGGKKMYERRHVDQVPEQRRVFKELKKDFSIDGMETNYAVVRATWMARLAGGFYPTHTALQTPGALLTDAKFRELETLLTTELKGVPTIVWFRFNQELYFALDRLKAAGLRAMSITGLTKRDDRHKRRVWFQNGKLDTLLIQVKVGRMGLDLSHADTAIYYSNSYAYEDRLQSEDRIVHPTRSSPLLIVDLITRGTIDEDVVELLREKGTTSRIFQANLVERIQRRLREGYFQVAS